MLKSKKWVIALFATLIGVNVFAILTRTDSWPITCYPMYSRPKAATDIGIFKLAAQKRDGRDLELTGTGKYTWFRYSKPMQEKHWSVIRDMMIEDIAIRGQGLKRDEVARLTLSWVKGGTAADGATLLTESPILIVDAKTGDYSLGPYVAKN